MKKLTFLLIAILIFSCSKFIENSPPKPLALVVERDTSIIPPLLARTLLLMELDLTSSQVSKTPIILYGLDGRPMYYEFQQLQYGGQPQGTLCAYARKEHPQVTAYILPETREYTLLQTKSAGHGYRIVTEQYPQQILYELPTKSGGLSLFIDEQGMSVSQAPFQMDAFIASLEADIQSEIQLRLQEEAQQAAAYWHQIAEIETELLSLNGEAFPMTKASETTITEYILPQYNSEAMQNTYWQGGCGPSALAHIYRGLYNSYKGMYLPISGDDSFVGDGRVMANGRAVYDYKDVDGDHDGDGEFNMIDRDWVRMKSVMDNQLYYDLADYDWYYWFGNAIGGLIPSLKWGASLPWNLTGAFEHVTNNEYTITYLPVCAISHIKKEKLPVVVLTSSFGHYLSAYGVKEKVWKWDVVMSLFGKKVTLINTDITLQSWLKVVDNGNTTSKHQYRPYWMDNNVLNTIFQFGVIKKN